MKTTIKFILIASLMIACNHTREEQRTSNAEKEKAAERLSAPSPISETNRGTGEEGLFKYSDSNGTITSNLVSSSNGFISSSAAVEDMKDTTRKFIRTADIRFRVKNVLQATYSIENIAKQFDGFVTYTHLASTIDRKTITPVSADSSLETLYYTVDNDITLRVPNTKLDTTLKTVSTLIDYLDYRTIRAEDVALQMLTNKLAQDRAARSGKRIEGAINERGKKLGETTTAEELLLQRQEQADAARIANLSIQDKINFSTVTLNIYQRQTIKRDLISNDKNIDAYKPGFGTQIIDALKWGWQVLEAVVVFVAHIWGLILLAVVAYILYKIFWKKS